MAKKPEPVTNPVEESVRSAWARLQAAVDKAHGSGLRVALPARFTDPIVISETGKVRVTAEVRADEPLDPAVTAKAADAAQSAAEKVVAKES
jgi:hypothetical protein